MNLLFELEHAAPSFGSAVRKLWESGDRGVGEFVNAMERKLEIKDEERESIILAELENLAEDLAEIAKRGMLESTGRRREELRHVWSELCRSAREDDREQLTDTIKSVFLTLAGHEANT